MVNQPSARACLACRSKHLKCNAKLPTCGRCLAQGLECVYVRSLRGFVGGKRRQQEPTTGISQPPAGKVQTWTCSEPVPYGTPHSQSNSTTTENDEVLNTAGAINPTIAARDDVEGIVFDTFYQLVHPAHPFLIPKRLYLQQPDLIPTFLKRAVYFVTAPLLPSLFQVGVPFGEIFQACTGHNAFRVQALLLLTIGSYARGERIDGSKAFEQAICTAHNIKLYSDSFGNAQSAILRESWRRTWWELYSIACILRILNPTLLRVEVYHDQLVPCHEVMYDLCQVGLPRSLRQMHERYFAEDGYQYSSFAYRVESIRILNEVLDFVEDDIEHKSRTSFNAHKAALRSFVLSLPIDRRRALKANGESDELMFCALTTIQLGSILLNLPFSNLPYALGFSTVCATARPRLTGADDTLNTALAVEAADAILTLLIERHAESIRVLSPCFSCILAFATTTHLSAFCAGQEPGRMKCFREFIQMSLGTLETIGKTWPIAMIVKSQLAEFSREVFAGSGTELSRISPQLQVQDNVNQATPNMPLPITSEVLDDMWLQDLVNTNTDVDFALPTG